MEAASGGPRLWWQRPLVKLVPVLAVLAVAAVVATASGHHPAAQTRAATVLLRDSAVDSDPLPIWGRITCATADRHQWIPIGGDPSPRLDEGLLGSTAFRRLTVYDGDDNSGERCELGMNDRHVGPTALFHEGEHRVTRVALRLPQSFPLEANSWQTVVQMKQTQPSDGGGSSPVIELSAYRGLWHLSVSTGHHEDDWTRWTAPARRGLWTHFTFDVLYSQHPMVGNVRFLADLNGDGDTNDADENNGPYYGTTLKRELPEKPPFDGLRRGASIPSHLRVGLYHDPSIPCPGGCAIDVDSVEVIAP